MAGSAVIEKLLVQIEANAAQLQAELAKAGTATKQFGATTKAAEATGEGLGRRYSQAAVQIAGAAESMARSGQVGAAGLKTIINQGAQMALMFGAGGAVVSAVGIATLAIIEHFQRAQRESDQLMTDMRANMREIRGFSSLKQADDARVRLGRGDNTITAEDVAGTTDAVEARKLDAQRRGVDNLRTSVAKLREEIAQLDAAREANTKRDEAGRIIAFDLGAIQRINVVQEQRNSQLAKENQLLQFLEPQYAAAKKRTSELAAAEVERTTIEINANAARERASKAEKKATADKRAAEEALEVARKNALATDQERQRQTALATQTLVDDMLAELQRFEDELREKKFTEEQLALFTEPKRKAIELQQQVEQLRKELADFPIDVGESMARIGEMLGGITPGVSGNPFAIAGEMQSPFDLSGYLEQQEEAQQKAIELGRTIELAARGGLQLAEAFGLVDEQASKALQSVVQIASALPGVLQGDPGSIISLVGVVATMFAKDPERARQHQENIQALRAIERNTGDLASATSSGTNLSRAREGTEAFLKRLGELGGARNLAFTARSEREIADLAGLSLAELRAVQADLNVTLDGSRESVIAFLEALKKADLKPFTDKLASQLDRLDLLAKLDPAAFEGMKGLSKQLELIASRSPAVRAAFEGIDLSAPDGPVKALEALRELFRRLEAGEITAEELGISVSEMREFIGGFADAMNQAIPSASDKFARALEAFGVQIEFGSLDAAGRLEKAKEKFAELFPELAASIDFSSADAFSASVQKIIDGFAADGELTEAERAQIEILRLLKGSFDEAAAAAEAAAEEERALAAQRRSQILRLADAEIRANDITDPLEQLKIRMRAWAEAFPLLGQAIEQFDLTTEEGRQALERWIQSMLDVSPETFAQLAESFGLTVEEFLDALLGMEDGIDAAATKILSFAEQVREAFDDLDFELDLEEIKDPIIRAIRTADVGRELSPEIKRVLEGIDLNTKSGRAAAEAALVALGKSTEDAALRDLILAILGAIRAVPDDESSPADNASKAEPRRASDSAAGTNAASVASVTEATANRMVDLLYRTAVASESMASLMSASLAGTLGRSPQIPVPVMPGLGGRGGVVIQLSIPQTFNGPVTTSSITEFAQLNAAEIYRVMQRLFTGDLLQALQRSSGPEVFS